MKKKMSVDEPQDDGSLRDEVPGTFEEEFQVEEILAKKIEDGVVKYLIKWHGFEGEDTWEPEEHLTDCPGIIRDFEERHKSAKPMDTTDDEDMESKHSTDEDDSDEETSSKVPSPVGFDRGLEPEKILGACNISGKLCFLMKWKGSDNTDIIPREEANLRSPQHVIRFYEDRIVWMMRPLEEILGEKIDDEDEVFDPESEDKENII